MPTASNTISTRRVRAPPRHCAATRAHARPTRCAANEVSWTPPPPVAEGDDADGAKDITDKFGEATDALKEGWRRAKQVAAVKVFKAMTTDDPEVDAMYDRVLQVELQIASIKQTVEAYLASLVEMCWSVTEAHAAPDWPRAPLPTPH